MKVFKYDISRSQKGELVGEIARPHSQGATIHNVNLPRHNPNTHTWRATHDAGYNDSRLGISYPFPVCFCTGQHKAGSGASVWEWVILMPRPTPTAQNGGACEENDWVSDAEYFDDYNYHCNPDSF